MDGVIGGPAGLVTQCKIHSPVLVQVLGMLASMSRGRMTQVIRRDEHSKSPQTRLFRKGIWEKQSQGWASRAHFTPSASPAAWLSHVLFCSVPCYLCREGMTSWIMGHPEYLETINYPTLDMPETERLCNSVSHVAGSDLRTPDSCLI